MPVPDFVERAGIERIEFAADIHGRARIRLAGVDAGEVQGSAGVLTRVSVYGPSMPEVAVTFEASAPITALGEPTLFVHTKANLHKPLHWSTEEYSGYNLPRLTPMLDYAVRDTSICRGPDGSYYLTGTTGAPDMWAVTSNIQVWKSADLKDWTPVVTQPRTASVVWNVDRDGPGWAKSIPLRDGRPFRPVWAPEIHYLKGTFWITYCLPWHGAGLLKSTSGKAEGPYASALHPDVPLSDGIDASLFEDDDGSVYFLYGGGKIARMKDDMSGLAEEFRSLTPANAPYVGFEGVYMFKANGRYYLTAADFVFGDYHCYAASSEQIYGPYGDRYLAVPHGGHNVFFQDKGGAWWSTFFGNDAHAPFRERPAALPIDFGTDGRIRPAGAP